MTRQDNGVQPRLPVNELNAASRQISPAPRVLNGNAGKTPVGVVGRVGNHSYESSDRPRPIGPLHDSDRPSSERDYLVPPVNADPARTTAATPVVSAPQAPLESPFGASAATRDKPDLVLKRQVSKDDSFRPPPGFENEPPLSQGDKPPEQSEVASTEEPTLDQDSVRSNSSVPHDVFDEDKSFTVSSTSSLSASSVEEDSSDSQEREPSSEVAESIDVAEEEPPNDQLKEQIIPKEEEPGPPTESKQISSSTECDGLKPSTSPKLRQRKTEKSPKQTIPCRHQDSSITSPSLTNLSMQPRHHHSPPLKAKKSHGRKRTEAKKSSPKVSRPSGAPPKASSVSSPNIVYTTWESLGNMGSMSKPYGLMLWQLLCLGVFGLVRAVAIAISLFILMCQSAVQEYREQELTATCMSAFWVLPNAIGLFVGLIPFPHWMPQFLSRLAIYFLSFPKKRPDKTEQTRSIAKSRTTRSRDREMTLSELILFLIRMSLPIIWFVDDFKIQFTGIMGELATTRIIIAFCLEVLRNELIASAVVWMSLTLQVLIASHAFPVPSLGYQVLLFVFGLASLRCARTLK